MDPCSLLPLCKILKRLRAAMRREEHIMQDGVTAVSRQCLSYVAISHFAAPACYCRAREREGGRVRERRERKVCPVLHRERWCVCATPMVLYLI